VTQPAAQKNWTILELLRWTTEHFAKQGIESARLDAECLLAHALGVDRLRLYVEFDKPLGPGERAGFRELVRRRAEQRVPVAHLVGRKEFWSLPLAVTPDVLTPRPETETLIEAALELAPERDAELRILDVGTGSGAVALALASERPKAWVTATDVSRPALAVARANAERLELSDRVRLLEGSLYQPVSGERFDLVVSNPPYLSDDPGARRAPELAHEPPQALFAAERGLAVLRALAQGVASLLLPGGAAAFEISPEQADRVAGWCREAGLLEVAQHRDLARRIRVISGRAPGKRSAPRAEGERSPQRLAAGEGG
jgi:release factor glutamine methyltransferase